MAKTRECCGALSLRRTGDDLHVSLHKGFKIRLAGIIPVFIEFTGASMSAIFGFTFCTVGDRKFSLHIYIYIYIYIYGAH